MAMPSFRSMFERLLSRQGQGPAGRSVEVFGWLCLLEALVIMFAPHFVAAVLHLPPLTDQAANYFRLASLLLGGIGMLYIVSGRLNAEAFTFASLLDRPLVPPTMAVLWCLDIVPGSLALAFSIQDSAGFLWTLLAWRAERPLA